VAGSTAALEIAHAMLDNVSLRDRILVRLTLIRIPPKVIDKLSFDST
jgi:hypothetical protein